MTEIEFPVKYRAGHSYTEPWAKTKFFCLHCGKPEVWVKQDGGDYYAGESYLCSSCGSGWSLPNEPDIDKSPEQDQRLTYLRAVGQ